MRIFFTILVSFLIISCGGADGTITVSADRIDENGNFYVPADGTSFVELTIKLSSKGGDVFDGSNVTVKTDNGFFKKNEGDSGKKELKLKTVNEKVRAKLYSTTEKGKANVDIKFEDPYTGSMIEEKIIVLFSDLEVGKKLSACNFSILCNKKNIPALHDPNISVECRVTTQNRLGEDIVVPNINFLIEGDAGTMKKQGDKYILEIDATKIPKDVEPLTNSGNFNRNDCGTFNETDSNLAEPCRIDDTNKVRNPRDGLLTIVAYANGENCFTDTNSNGEYDNGEIVFDQGEPYVDENDNAKYDEGESYVDILTQDNKRDAQDGFYSNNVPIFTFTKILLTGAPEEEISGFKNQDGNLEPSGTLTAQALTCGGSLNYTFQLMDKNMNPLSGKGESDNLKLTTSGKTILPFKFNKKFRDTMGISIQKDGKVSFTKWRSNTIFDIELISNVSKPDECKKANYTIKADFNSNSKTGLIEQKWEIKGPIN